MYSGEDPGLAIPTYISGIFNSGKFSLGIELYAKNPAIKMIKEIRNTVFLLLTEIVVSPKLFELFSIFSDIILF
ncbi:MAG: hypothetical protein EBS12_05405 [Flavobacteriia bacterium]|nr:hypothetical protein [Flavobacteriia bacterium]